jgi:hypothetical protein
MLVNLCDYKQSVTLIANSGVQFLDFGLTPQDTASNGRFVRKPPMARCCVSISTWSTAAIRCRHRRRSLKWSSRKVRISP